MPVWWVMFSWHGHARSTAHSVYFSSNLMARSCQHLTQHGVFKQEHVAVDLSCPCPPTATCLQSDVPCASTWRLSQRQRAKSLTASGSAHLAVGGQTMQGTSGDYMELVCTPKQQRWVESPMHAQFDQIPPKHLQKPGMGHAPSNRHWEAPLSLPSQPPGLALSSFQWLRMPLNWGVPRHHVCVSAWGETFSLCLSAFRLLRGQLATHHLCLFVFVLLASRSILERTGLVA